MNQRSRPAVDLSRFRSSATQAGSNRGTEARPGEPGSPGAPGGTKFSVVAKERRVQEILASIAKLPSLPTVVMEVMALTNREDTRAADFDEVIRKDQALAARVLKLVNSPFFARRTRVTSISQAIVVLGFKSLKSLVLAAKTSRFLDRQLTPYGMDAGGSWKHAIGTGAASRLLAKKAKLGADQQEALFVAGLLHDVGKVILAPHIASFQAEFDQAIVRNERNVVLAEEELVGISHPEVGAQMAEKWQLDPELASLIRNHHVAAAIDEASKTLAVVQVADQILNKIGLGLEAGGRPLPAEHEAIHAALGTGQSPEDLEQEIVGLLDEMQDIFQSLSGDGK